MFLRGDWLRRGMWAAGLGVATGVAAMLGGCQRPMVRGDYAAFAGGSHAPVIGRDYRLGIPDEVVVSILSEQRLTEHRQTLGPDGRLLIPGFGRVEAAGLTCEELTRRLQQHHAASAAFFDDAPRVTLSVRVERFASRQVFVFGQVEAGGGQAFNGANTVTGVVAAARPTVRADVRRVEVLRPGEDGELRRRLILDLDAMVRSGDPRLDVALAEGDVVLVPATPLGSIGLVLAQLWPGGGGRQQAQRHEQSASHASASTADAPMAEQSMNSSVRNGHDAEHDRIDVQDVSPQGREVFITTQPRRGGAGEGARWPGEGPGEGSGPGADPSRVRFWGP